MRPFDESRVGIERKRFSATQGEVAVSYGGHLIAQYGDNITLQDGEWRGHVDGYWVAAARERFERAAAAYRYAEEHYGDKDARFDVIVECMELGEIMAELERERVFDEAGAIAWARKRAGLHHEQELNQAWDGPESVKSSSRYDPAHDPAGPWESLARLNGPALRCTCTDAQLALVGCDCEANQNLPVQCGCGAYLRSAAEISWKKCHHCKVHEDDGGPFVVPYTEGQGAVSASGRIGPYETRAEAERWSQFMVDRYPYWVPGEIEPMEPQQ